ncbi:hypothetical protein [Pontibacter liquoris]|uniref:hypothetical protein n=1 Tax=Pontibacter liquoris TaxID=2905677 RepID=UPI001FA6EAD5|nr:hypothetical protein [Pontibacter liquoris]
MMFVGLFFVGGGGYALVRELLWQSPLRPGWAAASLVLVVLGLACLAVATDIIRLKDTYFSMTPEQVAYRVALFGGERTLLWSDVIKLWVTEYFVVFELENSKPVVLRLGSIQQEEVARRVADELRSMALQKNIAINGVSTQLHHALV